MRKKNSPKKFLASATLTGTLLLSSGANKLDSLNEKPPELRLPWGLVSLSELRSIFTKLLDETLPATSRVLTDAEELKLTEAISKTYGIKAVAELDGNRLNHQLGMMGLEQHLQRYPGDNISDRQFPQAGMAPGKGAWGYFTRTQATLTSTDIAREQYYVAVQTLYLPDWKQRLKELRDWYKYRKVAVINPENGSVVIAVIADAGPAKWTGKQFGGSPLVMHDLGFYPKRTKGRVVLYFVDDPDNQIPLGPVLQPIGKLKPILI